MASESRTARGKRAESIVSDYLVTMGYVVLGQNVRLGAIELDLVARKGDVVAVVEVRTRGPGSFERALESLSRTKRTRLVRGAERLWQSRFARQPDVSRVRIDVAVVHLEDGPPRVEYFEGAITGDAV